MNNSANNVAMITVRFGQAMHMDLSRASDEKLAAAYKTLDEYDSRGEASAYTQDKIDRRLSEIDDEGDRRAGVEPAPWNTDVTRHVEGHSALIAERVMDDDDTPAETREEIAHIVSELDPATTDGLVPGETSAI